MINRRMMLAGAAISMVAGCGKSVGFKGLGGLFSRKSDTGLSLHRNLKTQISSTTRFDAEQFSGKWHLRGEFLHDGEESAPAALDFRLSGGEIRQIAIFGPRKNGFGVTDIYDVEQPLAGRFTVGEKPYLTEYWVLWVDADYRTAVMGTPSGSFGWILDRSTKGGEDRIKAAKEILAFNGYNMKRLKVR